MLPNEEFDGGTDDDIGATDPLLQPAAEQTVAEDPTPLVQSQPSEPLEPRPRRRVLARQFERNVRARERRNVQARMFVHLLPVTEPGAFNARCLEPRVCRRNNGEK